MALSTRDQLIAALATNSSRIVVDKASITGQAAGTYVSLWRATGVPAQAAIPAAAAIPGHTTLGAIGFTQQTAPAESYLGWLALTCGNSAMGVEVRDRVGHMGGLSGTVTTAQAVNLDLSTTDGGLSAARRGDTNYSDIQWFLEWYTATGATGVNATCAVTYDDASTGNIVIALAATRPASFMTQIIPAVAGRFIRGVTSVTLSATTGTAGSFGVTATRPRSIVACPLANFPAVADWAQLGLPDVPNGSCLMLNVITSTTSSGTLRGQGKIAHA